MLYDIKNNKLRYWNEFDELGDRNDFAFEPGPCACGSASGKLIANTTRHRNTFDFVQCSQCGTIRIDPYLTKESIDKYYSETYGKIKRQSVPAEKLYKKQSKAGKLVFSLTEKFLKKDSLILDFGAGAGGKMNELLTQNYNVYIKELDKNYFEYGVSRGLKPFDENLKYDFIFLSRVLEHMSEPVEFLNEVKKLLAPGGHIYIEVPLIENSRDNYLLSEFHISHKFYFSMPGLVNAVALAGLEPVHKSRNLIIVKQNEGAPCPSKSEMLSTTRKVIWNAYLQRLLFSLGLKKEGRGKN